MGPVQVSDRQWGTVREDYSEGGDAWNYFPHDQARSRAPAAVRTGWPASAQHWPSDLYMDGHSLMAFTVDAIPQVVQNIFDRAKLNDSQIDMYLLHQATFKMLQQLRIALGVEDRRLPIYLGDVGNTVSSTLPILIDKLRREGRLLPSMNVVMIGFGVGWSWAGCVWRDILGQTSVARK